MFSKNLKNISSISIINFFLLCVPFTFLFFFHTTVYGYSSSKIVGLNTILVIILFLIILNIHKNTFIDFLLYKYKILKKDKLFIVFNVFVLLALLSALNSKHIFTSFVGEFRRWDGFMTLFSIYLYFILTNIFFTKKQIKYLLLNLYIVSFIVFIIVMISVNLGIERTSSIMGNPIANGQFFLMNLFFALILFKDSKNIKERIIYGIFPIICIFGIIFSETRGIMAGLYIGFLSLLFLWIFSTKRKIFKKINTKNISIIILILITLFSVIFIQTRKSIFWQKIPMINRVALIDIKDPTTMSRFINNKISIDMFSNIGGVKNMFLGIGQEMYLSKWFFHQNLELYKYEQSNMDRAHNFVFDLLIMRGILGTFIFFYLLYISIKYAQKINFLTLSITIFIFISYIIQNLFAFDFYPTNILLFTIMIYLIKEKEYGI